MRIAIYVLGAELVAVDFSAEESEPITPGPGAAGPQFELGFRPPQPGPECASSPFRAPPASPNRTP